MEMLVSFALGSFESCAIRGWERLVQFWRRAPDIH